MLGRTLKVRAVGEHREARGTAAFVALGDGSGSEIGTQETLAGARLLDLGNDGGLAPGKLRAQCADKIADVAARARHALDLDHRMRGARRRDLLALGGEDALEDVAHRALLTS